MIFVIYILLALVLDYLIGDPRRLPHPVKLIGWLAIKLEAPMRRRVASPKTAGTLTAAMVVAATALSSWLCLAAAGRVAPWLGHGVAVLMLYTTFAARDLARHARAVMAALTRGDVARARRAVARIVGRDTEPLDADGIVRATVESVAENTIDGVIAPLFFAFLGGPVAAMAYKAVSTLDSTFGYRNERYLQFGWASARLDDAANFIPARLGVGCLALAAWALKEKPLNSLHCTWRDGNRHASPNAGYAEAAMAGALGIRLGGPVFRQGHLDDMPRFGDATEPLATGHIDRACRLMWGTTVAAAVVFSLVRFAFGIAIGIGIGS